MNRIKEIRESQHISQIALARMAGVSQPFIYDLEHNKRGARPETYQRIAEALNVSVTDLMQKAG